MKFKLFAVAVTVLLAINLDVKADSVTFGFDLPGEVTIQPLQDTTAFAADSGDEFTLQVVENSAGAGLIPLPDTDDFFVVLPGTFPDGTEATVTFRVLDSAGVPVNFSLQSFEATTANTDGAPSLSVAGTLADASVFGPVDLGPSSEISIFKINSGIVDSIVFTDEEIEFGGLTFTLGGGINNLVVHVNPTSVPEPSALAVLLLGGVVAGARRRRR